MNSLQLSSTLPLLTSSSRHYQYRLQLQKFSLSPVSTRSVLFPSSPSCLLSSHRPCKVACAPKEGTVSVMNIEELMEKDWSFLETEPNHDKILDRIISAGQIEPTSKVLVSLSSEVFVDRLMDTSEQQLLLVVHDSLFTLACIKEKYDKVKCWQGELIYVPEKWAPFDVAFIYFLPALPFSLGQIFGTLAKRCHPGARVVVSHPQGRQFLEEQRREFPDSIVADLPDKATLQEAAAERCLRLVEYVDEPGLYLAVLKFKETEQTY